MGWPLSQDYNEAVQNPRTSFADPDLKAGEAVPGPLGLPLPRSGNFADVYQIRGADGRMWALKCFTRPAAKLRERYLAIDAHLQDARLPFMVGFQFLTEGVRIRNLWYPALKMEWVEGLQLNEFVRRNVDRPDHLRAVLGVWVRLCKRLRDARIAHADLQHGNVLLVPGATAQRLKLRLIDYDGMWVPALDGRPSGEAGHPNYQHPARLADRAYTPDVDRFPHLVIGCALRALAVAGRPLWDRFDNGDNLLFREADFADPANSKLLRALWELDDPTATNLVALLAVCAARPLGDTPWLHEVLSGDKTVPVGDAVLAHAADRLGVSRRTARRAAPAAQLFVVPEEANQFTEFGGETRGPRRRRTGSKLPFVLAGGATAIAAGIVGTVLFLRNNERPPDDSGQLPTVVADSKEGPPGPARSGVVDTKWTNFPTAPRAPRVERLVSGIDVAPPGTKTVRTYAVRGSAALGAWLRPGGSHAPIVGRTQIGDLDLATGTVKPTTLPDAIGEIVRAVVTPDTRHVITAGKDQSVRCLEASTGRVEWTKTFPGPITALAVTPDGERVAASGEKVGYIEWFIGDGSEVRRHELLQASLLVFSPDGSRAVAVNEGGVEIWALDEGKATVVGPGFAATAVCFTPKGEQALAAGVGRDVRSWAVPDGRELPERPALLRQGVTALAATADGTLLFGGPAGEIGYLGPDGTNAVFAFGPDSGPVVSFAVTADGRHALVASEKGNVLLTRMADLVRPDGPSKEGPSVGGLDFVRSTLIGPDVTHFAADAAGKRILTASATHLRVHDADTLAAGRPLQVPDGGIEAIGAGPDDLVLVCQAIDDGFQTRTYDPGGGNAGPVFVLPAPMGEPGRITRFVPVPDHTWVLATTEAAGDVLFDPATGKVVPGWPDPLSGDPAMAAPSPDGRLIAVGGNRPARLWTVDTQKAGPPLEGSSGVVALAFTPDGRALVGLWPLGRIRIWDSATGKFLREVDHSYSGRFTELAAIADNLVVLGSPTGRLVLNLETGQALNTGDGPDPLTGRGLVVPTRSWILAADRDERLTAWRVNPARGTRLPAKPPPASPWPDVRVRRDAPTSPVVGMAFAADGKSVLAATENGRLMRSTADRLLFAGEVEAEGAPLFGFAQAGDLVFTLGRRSLVIGRDAETLEKKFEIPSQAPGNAVPLLLAASPDGSSVVVSADKARLADVKTRKEVKTAALPVAAVGLKLTQFAFSADGRVSVARWGDTVTAVWNPKTGQPRVLEALPDAVPASRQGLALTPDGKIALLGTGDGKLTAWDTTTGKQLFAETVYPDGDPAEAISAVAVLPNGTHFLTLGRDGRLILWELGDFRKAKEFRVPEGPWRLAVAPDGRAAVVQKAGEILRIELTDAPRRAP